MKNFDLNSFIGGMGVGVYLANIILSICKRYCRFDKTPSEIERGKD